MIKLILKIVFTILFYFSSSSFFLKIIGSNNAFRRSSELNYIEYILHLFYFILLMYLAHRVTEAYFTKSKQEIHEVTTDNDSLVKKVAVTVLNEQEPPATTQSQLMDVLQDMEIHNKDVSDKVKRNFTKKKRNN